MKFKVHIADKVYDIEVGDGNHYIYIYIFYTPGLYIIYIYIYWISFYISNKSISYRKANSCMVRNGSMPTLRSNILSQRSLYTYFGLSRESFH